MTHLTHLTYPTHATYRPHPTYLTRPTYLTHPTSIYFVLMKFAPEYVTYVLNENFEDAKALLLSPMMAINYAHLVMLAAQGIVSAGEAHTLREALDGISQDAIREVTYDGSYEDLFFYVERLVIEACGEDV